MNFRTCPVCGGHDLLAVFTQAMNSIAGIGDIDYRHTINICQDCGFVLASPLLPDDMVLRYYERFSNYEQHHSGGEPSEDHKAMAARQIQLLRESFPRDFKGRALDVGCSMAYGLSLLKAKGWDVLGIDPSDGCIRQSKALYGVDVLKGFISEQTLAKAGTADAIILSHVLEHLVYPGQALQLLRSALAGDGVLYVEVPNLMENRQLRGYFTFEHVNYFTPVSLSNLARRAGFELERLDLFDNAEFTNSYPVMAATLKVAHRPAAWVNDFKAARSVMDAYSRQVPDTIDRLNRRIDEVVSRTPPGRLALWGAGIHTSQLLSDTRLARVPLRCIFDNDQKKAGHALKAVPIKTFPADPAQAKQEIDAILISSLASEDELWAQLRPLERHGIRIYRLYGPQSD